MHRVETLLTLMIIAVLLFAAGCRAALTPPREATRAAQAAVFPTDPAPVVIPAPTSTPGGVPAPDRPVVAPEELPTLTIWVNETSAAHQQLLDQMVANFVAETPATVELRLVAPALLPQLVETAVISADYDLPDIIVHPIAYTAGWADSGVLDSDAAEAAVAAIGPDTFAADALALARTEGRLAAIPSDGYQQLVIYRTDWFADRDLAPPNNFDALLAAAETLFAPDDLIAGFVVPTESNLVSTHQIFEHLAVANGCRLIDEEGRVLLPQPVCQDALNYYYEIIHNYSPTGVQTDTSTRNAYLFGRTGLIMSPPTILPQLAGLDETVQPTCSECGANPGYLAGNSGVLTTITGRSAAAVPANFGHITMLGITTVADTETAVAFVRFWFEEAYESWLQVEPERKVPLRLGTTGDPRRFIDAWGTYPVAGSNESLTDLYGPELVTRLRSDIANSQRWGLAQGQGVLISEIYQDLTFSVVLQEMLSGYFNTEKTLVEAYNRVIDLIPEYPYDQELEEEPNPS